MLEKNKLYLSNYVIVMTTDGHKAEIKYKLKITFRDFVLTEAIYFEHLIVSTFMSCFTV